MDETFDERTQVMEMDERNEQPAISFSRTRGRSRPTLSSTKSFPPYSQCIGGLGEDEDVETVSESSVPQDEGLQQPTTKCLRDERKVIWRARKKERLGGSHDFRTNIWEGGGWGADGSEEKEVMAKGKQWTDNPSEGERDEDVTSRMEDATQRSDETPPEAAATIYQRSTPHPILSRLLQSSSSSSSTNFSSAESDELLSEGEDTISKSKPKPFRKWRSWKTYLSMMQWSLGRQNSWVQLAGHQGNFRLSEAGEVLKLYSEAEARCLDSLMKDPLRAFVPQYYGVVTRGDRCYTRLEDLLSGLQKPVIMDCKMGIRTYQEEELIKARTRDTLRSDMYQKMVKIDPSAPLAEEHAQKGVTKWRYLQWRDTNTSTSSLGFRIEGIMTEDGSVQRDFRKILSLVQVTEALLYFTRSQLDILKVYHSRLLALSDALKNSSFFRTHEVIGSSLLFVHDHSRKANVWMIDFGKTTSVPDKGELQHNIQWAEGNREDGYLIGLNSLISSISNAINMASGLQQEGSAGKDNPVGSN